MHDDECDVLRLHSVHKNVIEIGSFRGGSAEVIARVANHLWCIDPHASFMWNGLFINGEDTYKEFMQTIAPFTNITYLRYPSDEIYNNFHDETVDIVVVDGDHSHAQCLRDLIHYTPKVKHGGWMFIHDYDECFPEVIAACMNYFGRMPDVLTISLAQYKVN